MSLVKEIKRTKFFDLDRVKHIAANFNREQAFEIGKILGMNWDTSPFTPEQLMEGMNIELEHGDQDPQTNLTNNKPFETAKIAWAHLKENPNYYAELKKLEKKAQLDDRKLRPIQQHRHISDLIKDLGYHYSHREKNEKVHKSYYNYTNNFISIKDVFQALAQKYGITSISIVRGPQNTEIIKGPGFELIKENANLLSLTVFRNL